VPRDRNHDATKPTHAFRYLPAVVRTRSHHRIGPRGSRRSRRHPRTPPLALACLGVAAALVAVAGNAQPTRPAEAAGADESRSEVVRGLDFTTVAQPGDTCADALPDDTPGRIPVERGESQLLDVPSLTRLEVDGRVLYGDLDGDGDDEAIVRATCNFGANGAQDTVGVWSVDRRIPVLVDAVSAAPASVADDSRFPPAVHDVAVVDDELVVTFTTYTDDDPHCCPTGQATVSYQLDGGDLAAAGRPVTGPLAA
jgi:LppP/LprE lipoprotein